jgi:hypothetical protein
VATGAGSALPGSTQAGAACSPCLLGRRATCLLGTAPRESHSGAHLLLAAQPVEAQRLQVGLDVAALAVVDLELAADDGQDEAHLVVDAQHLRLGHLGGAAAGW